jgi:hypothetical protein
VRIAFRELDQRFPKTVFTLAADDCKHATGLSPNSMTVARKQLSGEKLIHSTPVTSGFTYEILDPVTGKSIEQMVNFNDLRSDQLEAYFLHHLSGHNPVLHEDGQAIFNCPFHYSAKTRRRDLSVKLSDGGPWKCHHASCERSGKLVAFERAIAEARRKPISTAQAHHRIKSIILQGDMRRAKREQDAIEEARRRL